MILEKSRVFSRGKKKWHNSVDCKMGSSELWCGPSHLCNIHCALGEIPPPQHLSPTPRHLCPHPQSLGICHLTWPQGLRTLIKSRILIQGEDPRFSEWAQCLLSSIREIRGREAGIAERRSMVLMAVMSPGTSVSFPLLTVLCVTHTHPTDVPDTWCRTTHFSGQPRPSLKVGCFPRIIMDLGLCISKCCPASHRSYADLKRKET